MRVLLVSDDAKVSADVRAAVMGDPDIELLEVSTPQRGVAILDEDEGYDIVLGDADTAPSGGFFLSREIKARGQMGRDMPPVALFLGRKQDVFLSNWSQADAYILKPIDPFDLREVMTALVQGAALPALPGVGGDPTPSLLDIPGDVPENVLNPSAGGLPTGP